MSDFDIAYKHTAKNEGGFTWDPAPTAFGIDRRFWQGWKGWDIVDAVVKKVGRDEKKITTALRANPDFMVMVKEFFRRNFWTPFYTQITSQSVATMIFDRSVNMGPKQAHKIAQRVLGIIDDGFFGKKSVFAVNQLDPDVFCRDYDAACDQFYRGLAEKDPAKYARFKKTWEDRA